MPKKLLIPFALILMLVLAACGGQQTAEPAAVAPAADQMAEESHDDDMDAMEEESHEDDMDSMEEESHDGDMDSMEEEAHDDDMDSMEEEGHDDDMDGMEEEGHDDDMDDMEEEGHDDDMDGMEEEGQDGDMAAADLAAWQTVALTNAVSGEAFSLADFQGKTVFVEPMATWCGNCKKQQGEVRQAKEQLGDDVVFLALSLETNLPADQLAAYAQSNGFDWNYAVMNVELLEGLADQFGRSITNAPSTPHFVIRPDGSFGELSTGIHSAADIVAEIQAEQG